MSEDVEILRSRPRRGKKEASDWAAERVRILETKAEAEGGRSNGLEAAQSSTQELAKKDGAGTVRKFVEKTLSERRRELPNEIAVEELIARERERCREAVELLASGQSAEAVAARTGIGVEDVRTLSEFVPDYALVMRSTTVRNLRAANLRMSELLARQADQISADKLAFSLAIATEKSELLSGGVTQRSETKRVVTPEELQAMFEALPRANAKVIEESK